MCRVEVAEKQLRDDLLSMLVAGHETTGSALTWTLHLLAANPAALAKVGGADRVSEGQQGPPPQGTARDAFCAARLGGSSVRRVCEEMTVDSTIAVRARRHTCSSNSESANFSSSRPSRSL